MRELPYSCGEMYHWSYSIGDESVMLAPHEDPSQGWILPNGLVNSILILSLRLPYASARSVERVVMDTRGEFLTDPGCLTAEGEAGELELVVPYVCPNTTAAALQRAPALTSGLNARIQLIAVHALPYPLPFVCPALLHAH